MKAAGVLFVTDNPPQLFLVRRAPGARDAPGMWAIPAGEIEYGETAEACARREALEEIGFMPYGRLHELDRLTINGVDFTTFTMGCLQFDAEFLDLNEEHDEAGWFNVGNLPRPLHPGVAVMLARMRARSKPRPAMDAATARRTLRALEKAGGRVLKPVRPNLGIQAAYRRKLSALIEEMNRSVLYWIGCTWRGNPPAMSIFSPSNDAEKIDMAMDASITVGPAPLGVPGLQAYIDGEVLLDPSGLPRRFKTQRSAERAALLELRRLDEPVLPVVGTPLPAEELSAAFKVLSARWIGRFNAAAPKLAEYFSTAVEDRSAKALRSTLRQGGISVRFQPSQAQLDVLSASIHENVALIRSIPQQYLTQVEGAVMRSVTSGRDLGTLTKNIMDQYGVTQRRAALIARDQNNKATSAMTRARQQDLGITEAIWVHSHAGKKARPKHLKAHGTRYDVRKGLPIGDKGQYVFPGEEINCRCVARSVIPGFVD